MDDPESIWNYFVYGLDESSFLDDDLELISNAIHKVSWDMSRFDSKKHSCEICGQIGHAFNTCPCLESTNIKKAYIWLLILLNRFFHNLEHLDSDTTNQRNNQPSDLNITSHVTISQLYDL